jgi:putative flavoprotein involved in K+ transport
LPADFDGVKVSWPDGTREVVDPVIPATGYRPDLGFLASSPALGADGRPGAAGSPPLCLVPISW